MMSPRLMPILNHICSVSGKARLRTASSCWISTAQVTASTTLGNSAISASPQVLMTRPSWRVIRAAMLSRLVRRRLSVPASSCSMSCV